MTCSLRTCATSPTVIVTKVASAPSLKKVLLFRIQNKCSDSTTPHNSETMHKQANFFVVVPFSEQNMFYACSFLRLCADVATHMYYFRLKKVLTSGAKRMIIFRSTS